MAKEFFAHTDTRQLFNTMEDISRRSGVSRGQAFEDLLKASTAALAAETMEPEYFDAIKAHTDGSKGKRGVDLFPVFLGQLVDAMSRADDDLLGDLFQGSISYAENGLYLTPQSVSMLLAQMTVDPAKRTENGEVPLIADPCCGTGRLLLEAGKANPHAELVGQDIDARCARVTTINLGLRGKYGWVICGNSLNRHVQFVYRIGSFFHEGSNGRRRGVIRDVPPEQCPVLPEITQATRGELFDAVHNETETDQPTEHALPTIIEVPQWAFRLEQQLAASEAVEQSPEQPPKKIDTPQERGVEQQESESSKEQGRLF